jgi:hypothetical protein
MPTNNDTVVCPEDLNSCYFLYRTTSTYSALTTKCSALGGTPVQWNTAYEQQAIESYFKVEQAWSCWCGGDCGSCACQTRVLQAGLAAAALVTQCHRGLVAEDFVVLLLRRPPAAWASTGLR